MSSAVIVSLDVSSQGDAFALVSALGESVSSYKVGLQLLTAEGPAVVRDLVAMGKNVFIDLKLHEIPSSVSAAVTAAGKLGATMVTVHASAGAAVLEAAVKTSAAFPRLKVLALTVITSLSDSDQLHATSVTDQARVATPQEAAAAGATHIVLGRAITQAVDPSAAYRAAVAAFESSRGLRVSS